MTSLDIPPEAVYVWAMPERTDVLNWRLTPHLTVKDADAALAFYERAFGATVLHRHTTPNGKVIHASVDLHGTQLFLADDFPEFREGKSGDPTALGGSPVTLHLDVPDVDSVFARAVEQGATVTMPLADQFWGARYGQLTDPFGHVWSIQTQKQYLTDDQLAEAGRKAFG
jgi:PhnB protein